MSRSRLPHIVTIVVVAAFALLGLQVPASATDSELVAPFETPVVAGIDGTTVVGHELTATVNDDLAPATTDLSYLWKLGDSVVSTDQTYTPPLPAQGQQVTVQVTAHVAGYEDSVDTSDPVTIENGPYFTGDLVVGNWVTIIDAAQYELAYFDYFDDAGCTHRVDGVFTSVLLSQQFVNHYLRASVLSNDVHYHGTCVGPIMAAFAAKPSVSVGGTVAVGQTVTADVSGGDPDASVTSKTYQWLVDGTPADGATDVSFEVPVSAVGKELSVEVTSAVDGYADDVTTSEAVAVAAGSFTIGDPVITGDPVVAQTLSCASEDPDAVYAWLVDGVPAGPGDTYLVNPEDVGKTVTCTVTVSREGYVDATASAEVGPVGSAPAREFAVTMSGKSLVGNTLRGSASPVAPSASVSWQWLRDGKSVPGATKATYVLQPGDYGSRFRVRATVSEPGYESRAQRSDASDPVEIRDLKLEASKSRVRIGGVVFVTISNLIPGERYTLAFPRTDWSLKGTAPADGQITNKRLVIPDDLRKGGDRRLVVTTKNPDRQDGFALVLVE